jgi:hypothetical protein
MPKTSAFFCEAHRWVITFYAAFKDAVAEHPMLIFGRAPENKKTWL